MRKILFTLSLLICSHVLLGQQAIIRNSSVESMVREVSSDSLKSYIYALASFDSRHTLNTDSEKGMPAAQQYVLGKFNEFAKNPGVE